MHEQYRNSAIAHHARRDDVIWPLLGLSAGAAVAALTSNLALGALCVPIGFFLGEKQIRDDTRKIELMGRTGIVAPFLKGDDFTRYVDTFGEEQANAQAIAALRLGFSPYGDALDLVEERIPDWEGRIDRLKQKPPGQIYFSPEPVAAINAAVSPRDILNPQKTEQASRSDSEEPILSFDQPLDLEPLDSTQKQPTSQSIDLEMRIADTPQAVIDFLINLTASPLQPVIFAGLPGSGKGVLAAISAALGCKYNNLRFWVFNPKPKLGEAGYWANAEKHFLKNRLEEDSRLFEDLMTVLEDFSREASRRNSQPEGTEHQPFILIIEELNALIGLFTPQQKTRYKAKVIALASLLRGSNMAIWVSGQSVTLEDLGITGKSNRAMFTAIAAIGPNREGCEAICNLVEIPWRPDLLKVGQRFWITNNCYYPALTAPPISQYPSWDAVPNLVDLRPENQRQPQPTPPAISNDVAATLSEALGFDRFDQSSDTAGAIATAPEQTVTATPTDPVLAEWKADLDKIVPRLQQAASLLSGEPVELAEEYNNMGDAAQFLFDSYQADLLAIFALSCLKGEIKAHHVTAYCKRDLWLQSLQSSGCDVPATIRQKFERLAELNLGLSDGVKYRAIACDHRRA